MRNDSNLTYNTKYSRVQNFKDFESDIQKAKDEMKALKRGFKNNKDGDYNLPNLDSDKLKYNKITHKTDNNFGKEIVDDFIKSDELDFEEPEHKYKIEKEQNKAKMESYTEFVHNKMIQKTEPKTEPNDYSDDSEVTSYMFFYNMKIIHRLSKELLEMDQNKIDEILNNGHNWAEDHITSAKVQISQVYNFLKNKPTLEDHQGNYMFFGNLESIMKQCEELLQFNNEEVDQILMDGHDWAEDHISSAKENVEQVHDFLNNELQ
jgi:hypothetical protein